MLITKEWLKSKSACIEGYEWFLKQKGFYTGIEVIKLLEMLVDDDHWDWANWVIVRVMTRPQYLAYAIYAAEQVIDIYEKKYPKNDRPRKAINAAKEVLRSDTVGNRAAARVAAWAARVAAWAARAEWAEWAAGAARAAGAAWAAWAARAAAWAARAEWAARAAGAAAEAAARVAEAAEWATEAARAAEAAANNSMRRKILDYGISLLNT